MGILVKNSYAFLGLFLCSFILGGYGMAQNFPRSADLKEIKLLKEKQLSEISRKEHSSEHMQAYALSLDKQNPITVAYLENYMQSAGEISFSDEMFFILQDYMEEVAKEPEVEHYIAAEKLEKVRKFLGFKLKKHSEKSLLEIDFDYLANLVKDKGSVALQSYVAQKRKELKTPAIKDGKLKISFYELRKRLIFWDSFISQYGDFHAYDRVIDHYNHLLRIFLLGTPNSSLFDSETERLLPKIEKMYQQTIKKYPDTYTSGAVNVYYEWLLRNGMSYSDDLLQVVGDIMKKTNDKL